MLLLQCYGCVMLPAALVTALLGAGCASVLVVLLCVPFTSSRQHFTLHIVVFYAAYCV
jgi:hypothetical protein